MAKKPKPCADCGVRAKLLPRHFCAWCQLRRQPVHVQAEAARRRAAMVPEEARMKRNQKVVIESTPEGTSFCASCQSYVPVNHFGKGQTQCRGCVNAKSHEKTLEKTYGIDKAEYDRLLALQGGKCAICGRKPTGERRLAVDHNHQTSQVRGLLCSGEYGCNKGLLGSAHDDPRMLWNAYVYLMSPPAPLKRKSWWTYLDAIPLATITSKPAASAFSKPSDGGKAPKAEASPPPVGECTRPHFLPAGAQGVPGKRGVWRVWVSPEGEAPF